MSCFSTRSSLHVNVLMLTALRSLLPTLTLNEGYVFVSRKPKSDRRGGLVIGFARWSDRVICCHERCLGQSGTNVTDEYDSGVMTQLRAEMITTAIKETKVFLCGVVRVSPETALPLFLPKLECDFGVDSIGQIDAVRMIFRRCQHELVFANVAGV